MASSNLRVVLDRLCFLTKRETNAGASDRQLLERFVSRRDEEAFAALVQRHGPMVFGVCRRRLRESHDAEDAFQATFLVLARRAAAVRNTESVASFLHGAAGRIAGKMQSAAARRLRRERGRAAPASVVDGDALTWGELRSVLDEELDRLSASLRSPLVLCHLEGQTQDEAARRLGWSKTTLRRRLERGRRLLQDRLARRGVSLAAGLLGPLLCETSLASGALTNGTVQAALAFGRGSGGGAPVLLARSVLGGMFLTKVKTAAGAALMALALAVVGMSAYGFGSGRDVADLDSPRPNGDEGPQVAGSPVDAFGDALPSGAVARLGTARLRHGATAVQIDFAPDGKTLATAGIDGGVHIWEAATGKERLWIRSEPFPGGLGVVVGLTYSPDGKTLAGARMNQRPCLWDAATGEELRQFGEKNTRAQWIGFSADGKTLAYGGGADSTEVRIVEVGTGMERHRIGHSGVVSNIAYSPDGGTVVLADRKGIHFFDRAFERRGDALESDEESLNVSRLTFSPDGKVLAAVNAVKPSIRLIDADTRKTIRTIALTKQTRAYKVAFPPDGKTLVSNHDDGFVRFWDVASGEKTREIRAHARLLVGFALSRDGRTLATSCVDSIDGEHTIRLWQTATGKPLVRYESPEEGIADAAFSPDGRRVVASTRGSLYLWDAATGKLVRRWEQAGSVAFIGDGKNVVCGSWENGNVRVLDVATGKETRRIDVDARGVWALSLSRDGRVLATYGRDQVLRTWDLATGRQLQDFGGKQKSGVLSIALTPDGATLVSTSFDHAVRVWDTVSGKLVREHVESDSLGGLAVSRDGRLAAWSRSDGPGVSSILVYDLSSGRVVKKIEGYGDPLSCLAFAPDGRTLVWGGQQRRELYVFEVSTGQLRCKLVGHQGHPSCVAFSPNGRLMASGGSDATGLIWAAAGQRDPKALSLLGEADLDRLWADLDSKDAAKAYEAMCRLRAAPGQAVRLLERHLKPAAEADAKRVAEALHGLDSEEFDVRERAAKSLAEAGEAAEPMMRRVLAEKASEEVRRRVEPLLGAIEARAVGRRARALEVLEQIGDGDALRLLRALAAGAEGARLTREARTAIELATAP